MEKELWIKLYNQLKEFLSNNGHYPDINSKDEHEKNIAIFVKENREEYKNHTLTGFKEKLLNDIHFLWRYDKVKNDKTLNTWLEFKEKYDQELINNNGSKLKKDGTYKIKKLTDWESLQRQEEKLGILDEDKLYELNKSGFYFNQSTLPKAQQKSDWFKHYNELINLLKNTNGNYNKMKLLPEFKTIEKWYSRQIDEEKNGSLEEDRKAELDKINFPFESMFKNEL